MFDSGMMDERVLCLKVHPVGMRSKRACRDMTMDMGQNGAGVGGQGTGVTTRRDSICGSV